ncbi:MAG: non-canonical purine NTP pyrophosphatase [Patescibacteria group bacterium]|nr:non-canonical purine NTP pyrophosphatase [Patescibacteria group bacterium]
MKQILIATNNKGKAKEIRQIFKDTDFEPKFLFDFPEETKDLEIIENADSFEGNAKIKAIIAGDKLNMITLADDSGLCVNYLDGAPGVYSARYSKKGDDVSNYNKLLTAMAGVPLEERDCYYRCAVVIYNPKTKSINTFLGDWHGKVALNPMGNKSFGYAPIFLAKEFNYKKTNAECDPKELILINHRGKAFRQAIDMLNNKF